MRRVLFFVISLRIQTPRCWLAHSIDIRPPETRQERDPSTTSTDAFPRCRWNVPRQLLVVWVISGGGYRLLRETRDNEMLPFCDIPGKTSQYNANISWKMKGWIFEQLFV